MKFTFPMISIDKKSEWPIWLAIKNNKENYPIFCPICGYCLKSIAEDNHIVSYDCGHKFLIAR